MGPKGLEFTACVITVACESSRKYEHAKVASIMLILTLVCSSDTI